MPTSRRREFVTSALALTLAISCGSGAAGAARDEAGQIIEAGEVAVFDLRLGDCFDLDSDGALESVQGVPCGGAHDHEVIGLVEVDGDEFPGRAELESTGEAECARSFVSYVGPTKTDDGLTFGYIVPTEESWGDAGDREVVCYAAHRDERLVGSLGGFFDLEVGDCFDDSETSPDPQRLVGRVPCDQAHDNEVFHEFELDAETFPGEEVIADEAARECAAPFEDYTGSALGGGDLGASYLSPVPVLWTDGGAREVLCFAYDLAGEDRVGSVKAEPD